MNVLSDANIDGFAPFIAPAAALGLVVIAAGLIATVGFGRGVNGALNLGGNRLGLYVRDGFRHSILWQGVGNNGSWQRRNLHALIASVTSNTALLLPERNEETFKHLVANPTLEQQHENSFGNKALLVGDAQ